MSDEEESAIEKEIEVKIPDRKRSKEQEIGRNK